MSEHFYYGPGAWRAEAFRNPARMDVGVHLWQPAGPNGSLLYVEPVRLVMSPLKRDEAAAWREPSLSIPDGVAVALLEALSAWHGGTSEVRTLRRDYDHERKRVDDMLRFFLNQRQAPHE